MSPSTEKPCWYLYPYLYGYLYRKVKKSRWSSDRKSTRLTRLWRFTFDQFEVNHVGVHALALHTCSFAGLEPLQLLAGDTTNSLFVLATQRTSRYWTPTPQDTEHWNHICRCMFNRDDSNWYGGVVLSSPKIRRRATRVTLCLVICY